MSYSARGSDPLQELIEIFSNILPIGLLALIAGGAWLMATLRKLKQKEAAATPPAVDEAERTRRVQEEVRRKIAERRGRQSEEDEPARAPVPGAARSAMGEGWRGMMERREIPSLDSFGGPNRRPVKAAPAPVPPPVDRSADRGRSGRAGAPAVAGRRPALRQASRQRSALCPERGAASAGARPPPVVSPWLVELREPGSVRRAIVLREILGVPVGLR